MTFPESSQSILAKLHIAHLDKHTLLGLVVLSIAILVVIVFGACSILGADVYKAYGSDTSSEEQESVVEDSTDASDVQQEEVSSIYVHVAGAVVEPGMYTLDAGARVDDAVKAAGGFVEDANDQSLNLARKLEDGEQLIVPNKEEITDSGDAREDASNGGAPSAAQPDTEGKVNINNASAAELTSLKGIGEATADKIIADREENGSFEKASDIMRVSGIGEKKYQAIKEQITV